MTETTQYLLKYNYLFNVITENTGYKLLPITRSSGFRNYTENIFPVSLNEGRKPMKAVL